MGWRIETDNKTEWKVISSAVDDVIATFTAEHDLKVWLSLEQEYKGKLKAIETLMSFPSQWMVNGKLSIGVSGSEAMQSYYKWVLSIQEIKNYKEYYEAIDKKLEELRKK
ncbi:hypothetical protein FT641_18535 [Bacillus paranthracis]|uniref:hypothetical protein n=1 Tax=Bacillus paranthracis TaxID=2026186 RepID=UPI00187AE85B|nr:hypothetical protein [Bacillus paranthracis]MBE7114438.1 hypothetical protein [Bacillus paranthracis]MBE7154688.1 hypothetical protein [Bacillus paranthracis]